MTSQPNKSDPRRPLRVFYDGACPVCSREMAFYKRRDSNRRLECIDIAGPQFAAADYGLDAARADEVMHVRTADGRTDTGVYAFVAIWEALGMGLPVALTRIPGVLSVMRWGYRLFAANRRRLMAACGARRTKACRQVPDARPS